MPLHKFTLDLNTGGGDLTKVNRIAAVIGHWKNSACSVGSQQHRAAGLAKVNAQLSGADSGAAHVKTPPAPLSVLLAAASMPSCKLGIIVTVSQPTLLCKMDKKPINIGSELE